MTTWTPITLLCLLCSLTGCADTLSDVRQAAPVKTGSFPKSLDDLAECTRRGIENEAWSFGAPVVQRLEEKQPALVRVHAIASNSALFELVFMPLSHTDTAVELRRGYNGHGTEQRTWSIVESCGRS